MTVDHLISKRVSKFWKSNCSELTSAIKYEFNTAYESENDFYYLLWAKAWDHGNSPIIINNGKFGRDHIKKLFCRVVYGNKYLHKFNKNVEYDNITRAFKSFDNGTLLRLINHYKYNNWNLAVDVMKLETFFMDKVWRRLQNLGIKFSSIHDSIKVPVNNTSATDHIISDIASILGFGYHTKLEY